MMVIGPSGVQFSLYVITNWDMKCEAGVWFVNHSMNTGRIGQHKALLPINQNYYMIKFEKEWDIIHMFS